MNTRFKPPLAGIGRSELEIMCTEATDARDVAEARVGELEAKVERARETARLLEAAVERCPVCLVTRQAGELEHGLSCDVGRMIGSARRSGA